MKRPTAQRGAPGPAKTFKKASGPPKKPQKVPKSKPQIHSKAWISRIGRWESSVRKAVRYLAMTKASSRNRKISAQMVKKRLKTQRTLRDVQRTMKRLGLTFKMRKERTIKRNTGNIQLTPEQYRGLEYHSQRW
jgi:hypothetical protein